ncbi:glycosyl transferase GTB-type super family, partial [Candidatus Termititenax persephonae]
GGGNFSKYVEDFWAKNPKLRDKVIFTGAVYDTEKVWEWFNKAKVFVLTSRWEGFANVYAEAKFFQNYILSTKVGGAEETLEHGYGEIIPQEDSDYLASQLQRIIGTDYLQSEYAKVVWEKIDISWKKQIKQATQGLLEADSSSLGGGR